MSQLETLLSSEEITLAMDETQQIILQIQSFQRALREQASTLAAVSRLADDVLALVFVFVTTSPEPSWLRPTHLAFSHVCRRCRVVALQDSRIWT